MLFSRQLSITVAYFHLRAPANSVLFCSYSNELYKHCGKHTVHQSWQRKQATELCLNSARGSYYTCGKCLHGCGEDAINMLFRGLKTWSKVAKRLTIHSPRAADDFSQVSFLDMNAAWDGAENEALLSLRFHPSVQTCWNREVGANYSRWKVWVTLQVHGDEALSLFQRSLFFFLPHHKYFFPLHIWQMPFHIVVIFALFLNFPCFKNTQQNFSHEYVFLQQSDGVVDWMISKPNLI